MSLTSHTRFDGSIPENYDRHMGPIFFEPYARDLVRRVDLAADAQVLELACGTGIVTRQLRDRLSVKAKLTATDLNPGMLDYARRRFSEGEVELQTADATSLPFADRSYDAVFCQFGVMFFPDKGAAFREVHRVLRADGVFLFSVWSPLADNDVSSVAYQAVRSFFPENPPDFFDVPFGFNDAKAMDEMLQASGFRNVRIEPLQMPAQSVSARFAAIGLVEGTPFANSIRERGKEPAQLVDAVTEKLSAAFGEAPMVGSMKALIITARK